ncbi:MAG: FtsQ-type POTRA domain-containing protein [Hyphomicrobiaceae bacterium]|nr:FtsQ-type POTRA domain-containing protein [Hyphomicrobiaceae bacterium]
MRQIGQQTRLGVRAQASHALHGEPLSSSISASARPRRSPLAGNLVIFALGFLGAIMFSVWFSHGTGARKSEPLSATLDKLAVAAGFAISEITVTGHSYTSDRVVYAALGLDAPKSLIGFDAAAARVRIERLPWVLSAQVTEALPRGVRVHIRERKAFAIWRHAGRYALVDRSGRVLGDIASPDGTGLPQIAGDGAAEAADRLFTALAAFADVSGRIASAERVGRRRWTLHLEGGLTVHLPQGDLHGGLTRFRSLAGRLDLSGGRYAEIDLRSPARLTLRSRSLAPADAAARRTGSRVPGATAPRGQARAERRT